MIVIIAPTYLLGVIQIRALRVKTTIAWSTAKNAHQISQSAQQMYMVRIVQLLSIIKELMDISTVARLVKWLLLIVLKGNAQC